MLCRFIVTIDSWWGRIVGKSSIIVSMARIQISAVTVFALPVFTREN
jgi:hypothetical protein